LGDFRKRISHQSSTSFQLVLCACELKWDIYFQKSPNSPHDFNRLIETKGEEDIKIAVSEKYYFICMIKLSGCSMAFMRIS